MSGYVSAPGADCSHSSISTFSVAESPLDPLGEGQGHPQVGAQLEVALNRGRAGGLVGDVVDVRLGGRGVAEEHERRGAGDARIQEPQRVAGRRERRAPVRPRRRRPAGRPARIDGSTDSMKSSAGGMRIGVLEPARGVAAAARSRPRVELLASLDAPAQKLDPRDVAWCVALALDVVEDRAAAACASPLTCAASAAASSRRRRPAGSTLSAAGPLVPLDGRDRAAAQAHVRREPLDRGGEVLVGLGRGGRPMCDPLPLELRLDACGGQRRRAPGAGRGRSPTRTPPEPISGCRNLILPGSTRTRSLCSAAAKAASVNPRAASARPITAGRSDRLAASRSSASRHDVRQRLDHPGVRLLEASSGPARTGRPCERGELDQRERVPGGVAHRGVDAIRREPAAFEKVARLVGGERPRARRTGSRRGPSSGSRSGARRGRRRCGERQSDRLRRGSVQPMGVVHERRATAARPRRAQRRLKAPTSTASRSAGRGRADGERALQRLGLADRQRQAGKSASGVSRSTRPANGTDVSVSTPRALHHPHVLGLVRRRTPEARSCRSRARRETTSAPPPPARARRRAADRYACALLHPAHKHAAECTDCRNLPERGAARPTRCGDGIAEARSGVRGFFGCRSRRGDRISARSTSAGRARRPGSRR